MRKRPRVLLCLSANHRATPFEVLERLAAASPVLDEALPAAHEAIRGAVLVSTCNRVEGYLDVDADAVDPALDAAITALAAAVDEPAARLRDEIEVCRGGAAARHLFSVTAGLDSVAVGEDEIAGQVRRAFTAARAAGTASHELERLFGQATRTARAVKNATRLSDAGRSLVRLALELATSRVGDWADTRVLLVGTGGYAAVCVAALRARGARTIAVHSPSGRAARFAERLDLELVDPHDAGAAAARADVVLACTRGVAVDVAMLSAPDAAARRLVIDLGLPRNVDPAVTSLPGVEVLDLETIRRHARVDELTRVADAHEIVSASAQDHERERRTDDIAPALASVRQWILEVADEELLGRRRRGAPADGDVDRAVRHFAGVLSHRLLARGRELAADGDGGAWADAIATVLPDPAIDARADDGGSGRIDPPLPGRA